MNNNQIFFILDSDLGLPLKFLLENLLKLFSHEKVNYEVWWAVDNQEPVHETMVILISESENQTTSPWETEKPGGRKEASGVEDEFCEDELGTIENESEHSLEERAEDNIHLGKWQRRNMMTMQTRTLARLTSLWELLFLLFDLTWTNLEILFQS